MLHVRIEPRKAKKAKSGYTYRYIIPSNKDYGIEDDIKVGSFRTKKEAMEAGQEHLHRIMNGEKPNALKITLDEVWKEYLELNPNKVKPQTLEKYTGVYKNHIKEKLGNKLVRNLDYKTLQKFFNGVKPSRAKDIKIVINILMTLAVRLGYIQSSPTREIVLPKVSEEEKEEKIDYLSDPEFYTLLDSIKLEHYKRMDRLLHGLEAWRMSGTGFCRYRYRSRQGFYPSTGTARWNNLAITQDCFFQSRTAHSAATS